MDEEILENRRLAWDEDSENEQEENEAEWIDEERHNRHERRQRRENFLTNEKSCESNDEITSDNSEEVIVSLHKQYIYCMLI